MPFRAPAYTPEVSYGQALHVSPSVYTGVATRPGQPRIPEKLPSAIHGSRHADAFLARVRHMDTCAARADLEAPKPVGSGSSVVATRANRYGTAEGQAQPHGMGAGENYEGHPRAGEDSAAA